MEEAEGEAWIWVAASAAQLAAGMASYGRGYRQSGVNPALMPFRAFLVASFFVGAGATGAVATLRAAGIRKVEDIKEAGSSIRRWLGAVPRTTRAEGEEWPSGGPKPSSSSAGHVYVAGDKREL